MDNLKNNLENLSTPAYYYDLSLLERTLKELTTEAGKYNYKVHYALKANCNERVIQTIKKFNLGADCVSGNEVSFALRSGFDPSEIVFAGVGKTDQEILTALQNSIFCFNCESPEELKVINEIATRENLKANVALRINPNVNAKTHHYITTGLEENKFGINTWELDELINNMKNLKHITLTGFHFHIGSQITDMAVFKSLCLRVNEIVNGLLDKGVQLTHINLGGGLGINYSDPDKEPIADFKSYFKVFNDLLSINKKLEIHFEIGRAITAQCGTLLSRVLYVKKGIKTNFLILDAGMTELIRPALYQAYHKVENLSAMSKDRSEKYDVVGPVCESSDCFGKALILPESKRGDIMAIRSCGAYGEVMSSNYNLRDKAKVIYSDSL